ncbi:MAG: hypothetical protein ACT4OT_00760 [Acidobacteriota bacterium]
MKVKLKRVAGLFLILLASSMAANAQQAIGKKPRIRQVVYSGDMAHLLASLAENDGTVIGLETDPKNPWSQISIRLERAVLSDILNGVVRSEPLYQWRENEGAIEVTLVNKSISLIDTTVDRFQVTDVTGEEAINRLWSSPEVQANLRSLRLSRRPSEAPRRTISEKKILLNLQRANMRESLTRIAAESGTNFWIFRAFSDGSFWLGTTSR